MELLRTDTTFRFLGLSRNGWVSIVAFLFGVGWIIYMQKRGEKRTLISKATFFSPQPEDTGLRITDYGSGKGAAIDDAPSEESGDR